MACDPRIDLLLDFSAKVVQFRDNSTFTYDTLAELPFNEDYECIEEHQVNRFSIANGGQEEITFEGMGYTDFLMILTNGKFILDLVIDSEGWGDGGWGEGGWGGDSGATGVAGQNMFITFGPYESVTIKNDEASNALSVQVLAVKLATS